MLIIFRKTYKGQNLGPVGTRNWGLGLGHDKNPHCHRTPGAVNRKTPSKI